MVNRLVIVESPTKAKTIKRFLGDNYTIASSFGHVRDLPNNAAEVPLKYKKEKWASLGVNVENNFEPIYVIPDGKKKHVTELKKLIKDASELLLATDGDREGESISWHLVEVLKPKVPVRRMVFHEITKDAIQKAISSSREIDMALVRAQETRRIVDRLFGYEVSPLLWKKVKRGLSAGRVQSVAMRLLVERERERLSFKSADFWGLKGVFKTQDNALFEAELTHVGEKRIAEGKDFNPLTGKLDKPEAVVFLNKKSAEELCSKLKNGDVKVSSVEPKPFTNKPAAPFTTSTLQQEASRKLRFTAQRTMKIAQTLYENGLITYMRTDSTNLSEEALHASRTLIERDFGKEYLPASPRFYKTKVKNAQEAHEAIRPAGEHFVSLSEVQARFGIEAFKLYEMIWKRTIASQMTDAHGTRITASILCDDARFRASGKTITFPGFLRAYVEGSDDPDAELVDQEKILPPLKQGDPLSIKQLEALQHTTLPAARYTEGSLIKELERLGIGRPSTWASIVGVIQSREYAFKKGTALVPTFLAMILTSLMEKNFATLVDYGFTAGFEDNLDSISRGEADNLTYLKTFYYGNGHLGLKGMVEDGEKNIDPRLVCGMPLAKTAEGAEIEVRVGRYGAFLTDGTNRAGVPPLLPPDELTLEKAEELLKSASEGPQNLGTDPETNEPVFFIKNGPFGPYVQLGESRNDKKNPNKTASLLAGMTLEEVDLELALKLLALPRSLGSNPQNSEEVIAANGRYGPYIKCGSDTRSVAATDSPLTITLERALEILAEPKRRGRGGSSPLKLKALGKHPTTEKEISLRSGRFGPYVTDGKINASIPKGADIEALTLDDAVNLLELRATKVAEVEDSEEVEEKKKTTRKSKAKKE